MKDQNKVFTVTARTTTAEPGRNDEPTYRWEGDGPVSRDELAQLVEDAGLTKFHWPTDTEATAETADGSTTISLYLVEEVPCPGCGRYWTREDLQSGRCEHRGEFRAPRRTGEIALLEDGGGPRYFLDGHPVYIQTTLEAQTADGSWVRCWLGGMPRRQVPKLYGLFSDPQVWVNAEGILLRWPECKPGSTYR